MTDIITIGRITALALADSVNPCALAMLTLVLTTILIQNPEKRKKVLYSGLAFSLAVFLSYLVYGLIIIQFFKTFAELLRGNAIFIYKGSAIIAMLIGALNIKDFFFYKKGGFATEMPLWMRPKAKRFIEKITSPLGAFVIGFVITTLLLPCTIGPYLVASTLLSDLGILGAIPWLLYYNLLFVLPMLVITFIIYFGVTEVEKVAEWRERRIKVMHLIAGLLLFSVGFALLMGWI
jgi:cytochrome c biogenesis protein CcdA